MKKQYPKGSDGEHIPQWVLDALKKEFDIDDHAAIGIGLSYDPNQGPGTLVLTGSGITYGPSPAIGLGQAYDGKFAHLPETLQAFLTQMEKLGVPIHALDLAHIEEQAAHLQAEMPEGVKAEDLPGKVVCLNEVAPYARVEELGGMAKPVIRDATLDRFNETGYGVPPPHDLNEFSKGLRDGAVLVQQIIRCPCGGKHCAGELKNVRLVMLRKPEAAP